MATYVLLFDASGRTFETFQVPVGKVCYLVRARSTGTVTVTDLLTLTNYSMPGGVTMTDTGIAGGTTVSLAFMARTDPTNIMINAEVISPRI